MKIEKNKIVFGAVLAVIVLFLISYTVTIFGENKDANNNLMETSVPELEEGQKEYDSKLDAINDLKEVRETNAPSIYDEKLLDSLGYYDSDLVEKEKERVVDSIYAAGRIKYSDKTLPDPGINKISPKPIVTTIDSVAIIAKHKIALKEMGLEHQLFFASAPKENIAAITRNNDPEIYAVVDGDQVIKKNSRLRMRLIESVIVNDSLIPKNTAIFGFISFKPNRVLIDIENIQHQPVSLKAFDIQDGSEGIYVENNFRAEATSEVLDDIIGDINIPSVPQVSGITKVLKRKNRNVKVTVLNNYKLILKVQK